MATASPDFVGFDRALIVRSLGLNAEARKRAASSLFAVLYGLEPGSDAVGGVILWDELLSERHELAR